jgi:hypothetical protein
MDYQFSSNNANLKSQIRLDSTLFMMLPKYAEETETKKLTC